MPHLLMIYYVLIALVGVSALALSSFGIVRSRVPAYWYLLAFYAGFTLMVLMILVRNYLYLNVAEYSILAVFRTYFVNSIVEPFFLAALALFLHRFASVRYRRSRDIIVIVLSVFVAAVPSLPGVVTLQMDTMTLSFGPLFRFANVLYLVIFAYILLATGFAIRRDRPPRELVLISALLVFGIVGFMESLLGTSSGYRISTMVLAPHSGGLLASTVPYVLFGGILVYFFGAYLLADSKPTDRLKESFASRYRITKREWDVIELMNRGMSNPEIAERLCVSLATVKTHAHNIYEKTGASSRYDLFHIIRE